MRNRQPGITGIGLSTTESSGLAAYRDLGADAGHFVHALRAVPVLVVLAMTFLRECFWLHRRDWAAGWGFNRFPSTMKTGYKPGEGSSPSLATAPMMRAA